MLQVYLVWRMYFYAIIYKFPFFYQDLLIPMYCYDLCTSVFLLPAQQPQSEDQQCRNYCLL